MKRKVTRGVTGDLIAGGKTVVTIDVTIGVCRWLL